MNQSGYEATGCLDATGAYDAMYDKTFDLIVSDIMMPGIDEFEFVKNRSDFEGRYSYFVYDRTG